MIEASEPNGSWFAIEQTLHITWEATGGKPVCPARSQTTGHRAEGRKISGCGPGESLVQTVQFGVPHHDSRSAAWLGLKIAQGALSFAIGALGCRQRHLDSRPGRR